MQYYSNNTIFKILKELLSEVRCQKFGYKDMLTIKLRELLLYLLRMENNTTSTKDFAYIISYIRENFHDISVFVLTFAWNDDILPKEFLPESIAFLWLFFYGKASLERIDFREKYKNCKKI